jgi:subtilisin family serine protease
MKKQLGAISHLKFIAMMVVLLMGPLSLSYAKWELSRVPGATQVMQFPIEGEWVVKLKDQDSGAFSTGILNSMGVETTRIGNSPLLEIRETGKRGARTSAELRSLLLSQSGVEWVAPNYRYVGEARDMEFGVSEPSFPEQFHHRPMQSQEAWREISTDTTVVVAVTDDAVDTTHEDLREVIWKNTREIPGNGIDDDGNGYIDDVNGWDFASNDNDPNPPTPSSNHGTHCSGIIGAQNGNGIGIAGAAPTARVMPLRFYGGQAWTSALIARTYAYAVDNGAKIISTSFNIDSFTNDQVFRAAVRYGFDRGLLHFNSAGNNSSDNPARTRIPGLIFVCSTTADATSADVVSSFSNYGDRVHVCAPGSGVLSTFPANTYGRASGTSMATPNAAGVAALIWSQRPEWSRDQVLAQLLGTADVIDEQNPRFVGKVGSGRVNSFRALREVAVESRLLSIREVQNGVVPRTTRTLSVLVRGVLNPKILTGSNFELVRADGQKFKLSVDGEFLSTSRELVLRLPRDLGRGQFRLAIPASRQIDPFGQETSRDFIETFEIR